MSGEQEAVEPEGSGSFSGRFNHTVGEPASYGKVDILASLLRSLNSPDLEIRVATLPTVPPVVAPEGAPESWRELPDNEKRSSIMEDLVEQIRACIEGLSLLGNKVDALSQLVVTLIKSTERSGEERDQEVSKGKSKLDELGTVFRAFRDKVEASAVRSESIRAELEKLDMRAEEAVKRSEQYQRSRAVKFQP